MQPGFTGQYPSGLKSTHATGKPTSWQVFGTHTAIGQLDHISFTPEKQVTFIILTENGKVNTVIFLRIIPRVNREYIMDQLSVQTRSVSDRCFFPY